MKNFTFKAICFFAITLALNSCQEEGLDIQEPASITDELEKIETLFNEGDVKIENDISGEKIETDATFTLREKIEEELLESFTKQKTFSKAQSNNLVGVFSSNWSCGFYERLSIHMDCEDRRPGSYSTGSVTNSGVYRGDVVLVFCPVPNNFVKTNFDYAVLNLTSTVPNSTYRVDRLFDNEDSGNKNRSYLGGRRAYGWRGYTSLSGRNLQLSWIMYPKISTPQNLPSLTYGRTYGVLGKFGSDRQIIHSDDEDRRNANRCDVYRYNSSGSRALLPIGTERTSVLRNILDEGRNTNLYISKVN
jgi:hypothetical protein